MKDWSDPTDDIPPGKISNPMVENLNGAARITYTLPSDNDLLGVKAIFSLSEEEKDLEAFSSAFRDTIDLDGFPDTNERIVKLITVDKSNNESEAVEVVVNPLIPAVHLIRQTLKVTETFGGLYVTWENPYKEDIGISLFMEDSTGAMVHNYTYFTNVAEQGYSFRGLENKETKFQVQIRDNWERYSDPLDTILTPIFEEYLSSKDQYGQLIMLQYAHSDGTAEYRGDVPRWAQHTSQDWPDQFDLNIGSMFNTGNQGNPLSQYTGNKDHELIHVRPIYWILDLGRPCLLSRHKFWHWSTRTLTGCAPKHYRLWARMEEPPEVNFATDKLESLAYWTSWSEIGGTDEWKKDWDLIADCWNIPASGQTDVLLISADDVAWAKANGFEHEILPEYTNKPYRYIRFEMVENWGTCTFIQVGDIEFWGQQILNE